MRGFDPRHFGGLALLLLIGLAVFLVPAARGSGVSRFDAVTARGLIGSEKSGLLDNPSVRDILQRRHGVTVDYRRAGSLRLVQSDAAGQDFLWPSSQFARELYEEARGGAPSGAERSEERR